MKLRHLLWISLSNLTRNKKKVISGLILISLSVLLLLIFNSTDNALEQYMDTRLNSLTDEKDFRTFRVSIDLTDSFAHQEALDIMLNNRMVHSFSLDDSNTKEYYYILTSDDFRNTEHISSLFSSIKGVRVYRDITYDNDIKKINTVKTATGIALSISFALAFAMVFMNMTSYIDESTYDITLKKALGYSNSTLWKILMIEVFLILSLSTMFAILLETLVILLLKSSIEIIVALPFLENMESFKSFKNVLVILLVIGFTNVVMGMYRVNRIATYSLLRRSKGV